MNRESLDLLPTIAFSDDRRAKYETVRYQRKGSSHRDGDHKSERHSERSERKSERKSERHSKRHSDRKNDIVVEVPPKKKLKLSEKIKVEVDDESLKQEIDLPQDDYDQGFFGNDYFEDLPTHDDDHSDYGNDLNDTNDGNDSEDANLKSMQFSDDKTVEGMPLDEEYGNMVPISLKEAKAAVDILNKYSPGKYRCKVCKRGHSNKERLEAHSRMHEKVGNLVYIFNLSCITAMTQYLKEKQNISATYNYTEYYTRILTPKTQKAYGMLPFCSV